MSGLFLAALVVVVLLALGGCATWRAERNAPPIGSIVAVDGEKIHFVDMGPADGALPPVVLIHGASVNLRDMKMALGDELAKSRRVIIVDRPGRGYSTRPEDGWRLERQAQLIRDAVRAAGVEKPLIVGQSFGGAVALAYALHYQDEMSGLVLLAAVSHEWPGDVAWYNKASGWPVLGPLLRRIVIPIYAPYAARSGVEKSFAPNKAPDGYYEKSGLTLLFRPRDFKNHAADLRHLKEQIIAMSGSYRTLSLPVAIVTGDADKTVNLKLHSAALAEELSDPLYLVLPGVGHALHHAEKAKILAVIDETSTKAQHRDLRQNAVD
ncbi:MAG: alpha/beta hydrolase [Parvularculaceae bacterium]|nr:alpha/beta hydrolase [Parvularculaceae bacterium]